MMVRRAGSGVTAGMAGMTLALIAAATAEWPAVSSPLSHTAQFERRPVVGSIRSRGTAEAFCALPETVATWTAQTQCNSAPQFLSSFCADHVRVTSDALECVVDGHPCAQPAHPSCGNTSVHPYGGVAIEGPEIFYGNTSITVKVAVGNAVMTTITGYAGPSFGFGWNGGSLDTVGMSIGSGHYSAKLPFNAGSDYHRYDMVWGNGTAEFYADGSKLTLTPPLDPSDVPSQPLPLFIFAYACGASWCTPKFDCDSECPATTSIKAVAYTPNGTAAVPCANPPSPPAFCDAGPPAATAWFPTNGCAANESVVYLADHVGPTKVGVEVRADGNLSSAPWNCKGGYTSSGATAMGASPVHYGRTSVVLQTAGEGVATDFQLFNMETPPLGPQGSPEVGLGFGRAGSSPKSLFLQVGTDNTTVSLTFDPSTAPHNYTFSWSPDALVVAADGRVLYTATANAPQIALGVSVSVTPSSNQSTGSATIVSASYTPQDGAAVSCGAPPQQYKLLWEDDFTGTTLGKQWTPYDNCTHGKEAQLYVADGVTVADGMLKLTAFEFPENKTDRNGVQHRFGSGWVDSASNLSSRALNDCWSNNSAAQSFNFLHGKWGIRAKMPPGHFWTALWLMPDAEVCWPQGGEVDILESDIWGQQPPYEPHAAYHWATKGTACFHDMAGAEGAALKSPPGFDFSKDFHIYSAELTERWIVYSVDGIPYYSVSSTETRGNLPATPMYLILGNQLWSGWDYPSELPAVFEIDWVKAWAPE